MLGRFIDVFYYKKLAETKNLDTWIIWAIISAFSSPSLLCIICCDQGDWWYVVGMKIECLGTTCLHALSWSTYALRKIWLTFWGPLRSSPSEQFPLRSTKSIPHTSLVFSFYHQQMNECGLLFYPPWSFFIFTWFCLFIF